MYSFKLAENLENIPQEIIEQTNYIVEQSKNDEQIKVLSPQEPLHSCTMRQLDTRINLVHSRILYTKKIPQEEQLEKLKLSANKLFFSYRLQFYSHFFQYFFLYSRYLHLCYSQYFSYLSLRTFFIKS